MRRWVDQSARVRLFFFFFFFFFSVLCFGISPLISKQVNLGCREMDALDDDFYDVPRTKFLDVFCIVYDWW